MLCALPGRWRCKWGLTQRKQIEFNWLCYLLKCEQFRGNLLTDLPTPAYERTYTLSHLTSIVIKSRLGCGCDENLTVTAPITTLLQTKILDFVLWIYWSHLVSQPWMVQMNTTVIYCSLSITTLSRWIARSWIWISSRIFAHSLSSISSDVPLLDLPVFWLCLSHLHISSCFLVPNCLGDIFTALQFQQLTPFPEGCRSAYSSLVSSDVNHLFCLWYLVCVPLLSLHLHLQLLLWNVLMAAYSLQILVKGAILSRLLIQF